MFGLCMQSCLISMPLINSIDNWKTIFMGTKLFQCIFASLTWKQTVQKHKACSSPVKVDSVIMNPHLIASALRCLGSLSAVLLMATSCSVPVGCTFFELYRSQPLRRLPSQPLWAHEALQTTLQFF